MDLIIEAIKVGPLEVICYIVGCPATGQGMLIDPAAPSEAVAQQIARHQLLHPVDRQHPRPRRSYCRQ